MQQYRNPNYMEKKRKLQPKLVNHQSPSRPQARRGSKAGGHAKWTGKTQTRTRDGALNSIMRHARHGYSPYPHHYEQERSYNQLHQTLNSHQHRLPPQPLPPVAASTNLDHGFAFSAENQQGWTFPLPSHGQHNAVSSALVNGIGSQSGGQSLSVMNNGQGMPVHHPVNFQPQLNGSFDVSSNLSAGFSPDAFELLKTLLQNGNSRASVTERPVNFDKPIDCRAQFYSVIRNLDRKLTKIDLELPTSDTHKILTTCIPIQCRQCGARFFGDEKSRKEYDEHLDWHFRNNRSTNSAVHRNNACVSRALLLSEEAWLSDGLLEPEPRQPVKPVPEAPRKVPFIKAGMTGTRCTVCMEIFHTEWDDDVGEWVWKDAKVNEMGKADHDSCWMEVVEGRQRREREAQEEREKEEKEEEEKETTQKRRLEMDQGQEERGAKRLKL